MPYNRPIYYIPQNPLSWKQSIPRAIRAVFRIFVFSIVGLLLIYLIAALFPIYLGPRPAYVNATKVSLVGIGQALSTFHDDCGRYPTTSEGLDSLINFPPGVNGWHQTMDKLPRDGWGHPFIYRFIGSSTEQYDLYSLGKDGIDSTPDDIHLRDLN